MDQLDTEVESFKSVRLRRGNGPPPAGENNTTQYYPRRLVMTSRLRRSKNCLLLRSSLLYTVAVKYNKCSVLYLECMS